MRKEEESLDSAGVKKLGVRQFGCFPAILTSGAMFSLCHLGYSGFRTWEDLLLPFAVGLLKYGQFPAMRVSSTIAADVTLALTMLAVLIFSKTNQTMRRQSIMELIKLTHDNIGREHICCAISSSRDVQAASKKNWLKERLDEGLVFLKGNVRGKCFIEYIPAEYAWAPIEAEGYMHIDCLWVSGQFKGHGYSNLLLNACIEDSRAKGKKGFAILSSKKKMGFLSDPGYMRHKGFVTADTAEPHFELLYLPFGESAERPRFRNTVREHEAMPEGFVLYYTNQCPFTAKYVPVLEGMAKARNAVFQTVHIRTREDAQNAPSPFTAFSLFYNGQLVTHEILSEKKFDKILAAYKA